MATQNSILEHITESKEPYKWHYSHTPDMYPRSYKLQRDKDLEARMRNMSTEQLLDKRYGGRERWEAF